jgi:hypothetical protein
MVCVEMAIITPERPRVADIPGISFYKSKYYRGRFECVLWGRRSKEILEWIKATFGETDDMVYATEEHDAYNGYDALVTEEQMALTLLRWSS